MSTKITQLRPRRIFSESVRRHIVEQIELGKLSVLTAARENGLHRQSIYKWIDKYSRHLQRGQTLVVQMDSEASKTKELQKRIHDLEAALGRKQMEVDFLNKMIEIGKDELGIDLKKIKHATLNWFRINAGRHNYRLNDLCKLAGITKQALHQFNQRKQKKTDHSHKIFEEGHAIRKGHPGVGCRQIALDLKRPGWGRDKTERLLLNGGLRLKRKPNFTKTTFAQSQVVHPNLIEGKEISDINKVAQTDTTYYEVKGRFYYITFIIDVYSRFIVGFKVSDSLKADANIEALVMFVEIRKPLPGVILHSDKARQMIAQGYVRIINDHQIKQSMCNEAWENAYSERLNRTIKEEYLNLWKIDSYKSLIKRTQMAVDHYNHKRKHKSLGNIPPAAFERLIKTLRVEDRPTEVIYKKLVIK